MSASSGDFVLPVDKPEGPTSHDVVRHRLVGHIVAAYDRFEAGRAEAAAGDSGPDHQRRPRSSRG